MKTADLGYMLLSRLALNDVLERKIGIDVDSVFADGAVFDLSKFPMRLLILSL